MYHSTLGLRVIKKKRRIHLSGSYLRLIDCVYHIPECQRTAHPGRLGGGGAAPPSPRGLSSASRLSPPALSQEGDAPFIYYRSGRNPAGFGFHFLNGECRVSTKGFGKWPECTQPYQAAEDGIKFRGGLVFKAHRLMYHSTLGLRVIKKKRRIHLSDGRGCARAP